MKNHVGKVHRAVFSIIQNQSLAMVLIKVPQDNGIELNHHHKHAI